MRIHKEGTVTLLIVFFSLFIVNGLLFEVFNMPGWLKIILVAVSIGFFSFHSILLPESKS
jgi:hypothetical protein